MVRIVERRDEVCIITLIICHLALNINPFFRKIAPFKAIICTIVCHWYIIVILYPLERAPARYQLPAYARLVPLHGYALRI